MGKTAHIIDGRKIAGNYTRLCANRIESLYQAGARLSLATIQIGESNDITLYVKPLQAPLSRLKIEYVPRIFSEKATQPEVLDELASLNQDEAITGIMVFSPLPKSMDSLTIANSIDLLKDVEGRRVIHGNGNRIISPTARAAIQLITETKCQIAGKEAVIVGHSDLVGKPVAILLLDQMATVTVCHLKTQNLESYVRRADILVSAAGKPALIKGEWIKPGAVVIDVAENSLQGKIVGDVEFEKAKENASFISPVPGGVGPLTSIMLIQNLLNLHELQQAIAYQE